MLSAVIYLLLFGMNYEFIAVTLFMVCSFKKFQLCVPTNLQLPHPPVMLPQPVLAHFIPKSEANVCLCLSIFFFFVFVEDFFFFFLGGGGGGGGGAVYISSYMIAHTHYFHNV